MVQTAPAQCVVQIAAAVGGQYRHRWALGDERAEFGDRDRRLAEELQQQRFEFVIGAVDLVDQQDRLSGPAVANAGQDGPVNQIGLGVQVRFIETRTARFG